MNTYNIHFYGHFLDENFPCLELCKTVEFHFYLLETINPLLKNKKKQKTFFPNHIFQTILDHCSQETRKREMANSADPDQMPQNAASNQGLYCLQTVQPFFSRNM